MDNSTLLILLAVAVLALAAIPLVKRYVEPLAFAALILGVIVGVAVLVR